MPQFDDYTWVPLFRALNPVDARLVAARLDDEKIPVTYRNDGGENVTPVAFGLPADFVILVPAEYYDRALAVLVTLGIIGEDPEETDDFDGEDTDWL
jgi:hypothetical protein